MGKRIEMRKAKLINFLIVCLAMGQIGAGKLEMSDLERTPDGKFTPTFEVEKVPDAGTLVLGNDISINLVGIKRSQSPELVSFVKGLVSKKRVALVSDKNTKGRGPYYVYLLGIDDKELPFEINKSDPEIRGFLDLKTGFNVAKGMTYNLNTILLRAGYAEVDRTYPFEYLSYFEQCEEEARQNQRGLWKNGAMSATRSDVLDPALEGKLTELAKEKAAENNLPIENYSTKIVREGDLWVVEFHPTNTNQLGGGGRFWFRVKEQKITFEKMERWE